MIRRREVNYLDANSEDHEAPPVWVVEPVHATITRRLREMKVSRSTMARDLGLSLKHVSRILLGRDQGSVRVINLMLGYVGMELVAITKERGVSQP